jgi:type I restriction enzyme S subunit
MKYPASQDCDTVESDWLGALPKRWSRRRLRFAAAEPLMYGANEAAVLDDRSLPRYIRITDVKADGTLHDDTFRSLEEDVAAPFLLNDGDILLARSGATVGKSFQYLASWGRAAYAGYLIRFRPDKDVVFPRFANYYFQTGYYWACINSTLIQATIENFSAEKYKDLNLPLPPQDEQQQIAAFLDWKTGQIDALIARKKELLEKLKEKRLAVITQAVTRGLKPTAPLLDSGIPWLGLVPAHWQVLQIGRMITLQRGVDITKDEQEEGDVPVVSSGGIASYHSVALVKAPGVIVGRKGTAGALYYIQSDYWPHDTTLYVRDFWGNHPRFVYYKLLSMDLASYDTGTANPTVNRNVVHPVKVSWPPVGEQFAISNYLDRTSETIDAMAAKVTEVITRLTEYRTALITAATTGKIDVRGVKIPPPAG